VTRTNTNTNKDSFIQTYVPGSILLVLVINGESAVRRGIIKQSKSNGSSICKIKTEVTL